MDHLPPHRSAAPPRPFRSRPLRLAVGLLAAALLLAGCDLIDEVLPGGPAFTVTPTSVTLEAEVGQSDTATLTVANTGEASLSVDLTTDAPSLSLGTETLAVAAGASRDVAISLACSAEFASNATVGVTDGTDTVTVDVSLNCTPSSNTAFTVAPSSLELSAQVGSDASETLTVTNTSGGELTVTSTSDAAALTLDPSSLTIADGGQATATATLDCTGELSTGATVTVSDGSNTSVVTADLTCIAATADTVFLVGEASEAETVAENVTLNAPGDTASFTASADAPWLDVQPASGNASGGTVTLDVSQTCGSVRDVQVGTVRVAFGTGSSIEFEVFRVCAPAPSAGYNIALRFSGAGFTVDRLNDFLDAAIQWESVIVDDLPTLTPSSTAGCADGVPDRGGVEIDDLLIDARIGPIDGPIETGGSILAQAGWCTLRANQGTAPLLPAYGVMNFDEADLDRVDSGGQFGAVILHEMGHVLGIGTLWSDGYFDLLEFTTDPPGGACRIAGSFTADPFYTGTQAIAAYDALGGSGNVPVEASGGPGTQCGHWDEGEFDNELMTGYLDAGTANPLSDLTSSSLLDLGYAIDPGASDAYALPACRPDCGNLTDGGLNLLAHEVILEPRYVIDPDGTQREIAPRTAD